MNPLLLVALPLSLFISSGTYEKNNTSYNCEEEGIYRFGTYPEKTEQRIVYCGNTFI